jgi:hypothetical protein
MSICQRFEETETYRSMEDVWGKLKQKLDNKYMVELEKRLLEETNQCVEHKSFIHDNFSNFVQDIDVGSVVHLCGDIDVDGVVLNVAYDCFEIKIIQSEDMSMLGKKMWIDEKIMSEVFYNCML